MPVVEESPPANDDALRSLVRRYTEAWAASDRDAWLSTFAPDATQEDPVGEEWVIFDGVDVFSFNELPLTTSVRAYGNRGGRLRTPDRP